MLPDLLSQASASPGTPSARDKSQSEEVRVTNSVCQPPTYSYARVKVTSSISKINYLVLFII